jgi:hypothetical protein
MATPARHGPAHADRGPVVGFVLDQEVWISDATVIPLHFEGWEHFSESRADVERAFAAAGLSDRLQWPAADLT